jgi:hypothetical protein
MEHREALGWPTWVGVVVDDLERQRRFWGHLVGLPEASAGSDYVQFDMGGGRVFELLQRSERPQYDELRFQVGFAVEGIVAARAHLLRAGVGLSPRSKAESPPGRISVTRRETCSRSRSGPKGSVATFVEEVS